MIISVNRSTSTSSGQNESVIPTPSSTEDRISPRSFGNSKVTQDEDEDSVINKTPKKLSSIVSKNSRRLSPMTPTTRKLENNGQQSKRPSLMSRQSPHSFSTRSFESCTSDVTWDDEIAEPDTSLRASGRTASSRRRLSPMPPTREINGQHLSKRPSLMSRQDPHSISTRSFESCCSEVTWDGEIADHDTSLRSASGRTASSRRRVSPMPPSRKTQTKRPTRRLSTMSNNSGMSDLSLGNSYIGKDKSPSRRGSTTSTTRRTLFSPMSNEPSTRSTTRRTLSPMSNLSLENKGNNIRQIQPNRRSSLENYNARVRQVPPNRRGSLDNDNVREVPPNRRASSEAPPRRTLNARSTSRRRLSPMPSFRKNKKSGQPGGRPSLLAMKQDPAIAMSTRSFDSYFSEVTLGDESLGHKPPPSPSRVSGRSPPPPKARRRLSPVPPSRGMHPNGERGRRGLMTRQDSFAVSSRSFFDKKEDDNESVDHTNTNRGAGKARRGRRMSQCSTISYDLKSMSGSSQERGLRLQDLTINKLDFEAVGMVGRAAESQTVEGCLNRMIAKKKESSVDDAISNNKEIATKRGSSVLLDATKKEIVFIGGLSGVGKSMLASCLKPLVEKSTSGFFVRGKFYQNRVDEPYSAVASAFGDLCQQIKKACDDDDTKTGGTKSRRKGDSEVLKSIGDNIVKQLGSEVGLLVHLVPEVALLIPSSSTPEHSDADKNLIHEAGNERWKYAMRVLTRILSSQFSPLVFTFDDLQWSDEVSLELINFLISDMQNPSPLMIIGCYRSNEVDSDHLLQLKMNNMKAMQEKLNCNVTEITLENLPLAHVHEIITSLLCSSSNDRTKRLAEICLKRTLGNPFFVIEFMNMLHEEQLLEYNLGLLKWIWDESEIEQVTMSTENVVELLLLRMKRLSLDVQQLLQFASCLGSRFKLSTIEKIWTKLVTPVEASSPKDELQSHIAVLEKGNFIENCGANEFRWVHDKVQEVALSLGRASEDSFQFEVGAALFHSLTEAEIDEVLFDVANLLNRATGTRRVEYAELNLKAAEKARKLSAFYSASRYIASGIQFLPSDAWTSNRELTLQLYSIGAMMELALGQTEEMEAYMRAVLDRKDCSMVDKFPLHLAKMSKLCTVDLKYNETIDYCLGVLKELDCNLVFSNALLKVQAFASLTRTIKMAKKLKKDDYRNLKLMTDPKHQATMLLAQRLTIACYLQPSSRNSLLMIVCLTRMVQITLEHGVGLLAGPAFTTLGQLAVAAIGDFESAVYFCETALLLQDRVPSKYASAITLYNSHSSVLAWVLPLQNCLPQISTAYSHGMLSGNTEQAMWALLVYNVFMPFQMGKSLDSILSECEEIALQTNEVQQHEQQTFLNIFWQLMLNLVGESENTTELEGEVFDCCTFESKTDLQDALYYLAQLELYIFFGEFESAAKLALKRGNRYEKAAPGYFLGMMETFHRGVALYAMALRTKKRQYKVAAKTVLKTISKWVESGNPNVKQYQLLLLAEDSALKKKYKAAKAYYHDAFVFAGRTGRLHDAALIAERHAEFLHSLGEKEEAEYQQGESIRFYREWGANAKLDKMLGINFYAA